MTGRLQGKIAIVTGGAKSLGMHFATALAREGARVAIGDIADGKETAHAISEVTGSECFYLPLDVAKEDSVEAFVAAVMERWGRIDILLNNAALFAALPQRSYRDIPVEEWDRVQAINLRGPFLMVKHVGPVMEEQEYGRIINISSGTAYKGMPRLLSYVTSKAGVLGFTRTLARELGSKNITVNSLAPGLIESESVRGAPEHLTFSDKVVASRAMPRTGHPQDLLGGLIFLASDDSAFVSGQTLAVDGGSVML